MSKHATEGYQFDIINGVIAAVYESSNGQLRLKEMDVNDVWTLQDSTVVKTELDHGRVQVTTYADTNGDGIYAKVSKLDSSFSGTESIQRDDGHGINQESAHTNDVVATVHGLEHIESWMRQGSDGGSTATIPDLTAPAFHVSSDYGRIDESHASQPFVFAGAEGDAPVEHHATLVGIPGFHSEADWG